MILVGIGGAAIEGRGYIRPCRVEMKTFYFVYHEATIQHYIISH